MIEELFILHGASIGYWRGVSMSMGTNIPHLIGDQYHNCLVLFLQDVKLLLEDIGALKPTIFCAVPRVLDRIYAGKLLAGRASEFDFRLLFVIILAGH